MIELSVPTKMVTYLERYLECHRPLLLGRRAKQASSLPESGPQTRALWISGCGTPLTATSLSQRIGAVTVREFGVRINPHLFRDCAVSSISNQDPDHMILAGVLLGTRTIGIVERHYNHGAAEVALRRYHETFLSARTEAIDGARARTGLRTRAESPRPLVPRRRDALANGGPPSGRPRKDLSKPRKA